MNVRYVPGAWANFIKRRKILCESNQAWVLILPTMVCLTAFSAGASRNLQLAVKKELLEVRNVPASSDRPSLNHVLLCKLAARLHRFPLLGLQTFAALYRLTRNELDLESCHSLNPSKPFSTNSTISDCPR